MIKILGKPGDVSGQIQFTPRPGFRQRVPALERELIYGHSCPTCSNLVQAYFYTPQPLNLFPYEETTILSQGEKNAGEVLKVVPGRYASPQDSCYNVVRLRGVQRITLKNHVMRLDAMRDRSVTGDGLWEPGERPCLKSGIFALREDLLVKDLILFSTMMPIEIDNYDIPKVAELFPVEQFPDSDFRWVSAVGKAPPMILIDRDDFKNGFHYSLRNKLHPFLKKPNVVL